MTQGGAALPVVASTDPPAAGPALRVAVVSDGRPVQGGPAQRVVVVSDGRPSQGNPPIPVVVATGAQAGQVLAGPPIPVVVVSGTLGTNPATIAGAKAWWQAADIAQADGSAITTWTDSIGGLAPTQATAGNKPTYRTTQGPNSLPCVSFDGGDNLSVTTLASNLFASNQTHIFLVMKQTGTDAQNCPLCFFSGGSNTVEAFLSYDDVLYFDFNSSGVNGRVSVAQPGGWDNAWHLVQLIRNPPNSGTSAIRVDGSQVVSGNVSETIVTSTNSPIVIGAQQTSGAIGFTGFLTDILIYNVALSASDRQSVEAYFNARYSLF